MRLSRNPKQINTCDCHNQFMWAMYSTQCWCVHNLLPAVAECASPSSHFSHTVFARPVQDAAHASTLPAAAPHSPPSSATRRRAYSLQAPPQQHTHSMTLGATDRHDSILAAYLEPLSDKAMQHVGPTHVRSLVPKRFTPPGRNNSGRTHSTQTAAAPQPTPALHPAHPVQLPTCSR